MGHLIHNVRSVKMRENTDEVNELRSVRRLSERNTRSLFPH